MPAKRVPDVIEALTERYVAERGADENFQTWVKDLGRKEIKGDAAALYEAAQL